MFKELIRRLMFPIAFFTDGTFYAEEGTLKFKFLQWLYGEPEPLPELYLEEWGEVEDSHS